MKKERSQQPLFRIGSEIVINGRDFVCVSFLRSIVADKAVYSAVCRSGGLVTNVPLAHIEHAFSS